MTRRPAPPPIDEEPATDVASLEQAAHWYAVLQTEGTRGEQARAWARWLAERPQHRRAWAHVEAVSRRFEPLRANGQRNAAAAALGMSVRSSSGRRRVLRAMTGLGGAGALGWLGWRYPEHLPDLAVAWSADHHTGVGERRDIVLADGTRVWLNTRSALDVRYDGARRLLVLKMGEILVETGRSPEGLPFYVDTRFGRMQALGTRFTVRDAAQATLLAVFDGRVEIRNRAGASALVTATQQRAFTADAIFAAAPADAARESWSRGIILARDITLEALIAEVARYRSGLIDVDPAVRNLRVDGRYPANDPDRILAMLERELPIRVRRDLPWRTSIVAAR